MRKLSLFLGILLFALNVQAQDRTSLQIEIENTLSKIPGNAWYDLRNNHPMTYVKPCEEVYQDASRYLETHSENEKPPFILFDCLKGSEEYVVNSLKIFMDDIDTMFLELDDLQLNALKLQVAIFDIIEKMEKDIVAEIGSNRISQERVVYYRSGLMTLDMFMFAQFRYYANLHTGVVSKGNLFDLYYMPYAQKDPVLVQSIMGFENLEEAILLRDYLKNYGMDLRDTPVRITTAQAEIKRAGERMAELGKKLAEINL